MRITTSGDVGIGTSSPSQRLHLDSASSSGTSVLAYNDNNSAAVNALLTAYGVDVNGSRVGFGNNAYPSAAYTFGVTRINTNQSAWAWSSYVLNSANEAQSAMTLQYVSAGGTQTERLRIDASGNVGIGADTAASARVHINSTSPSGFEDTGNTLRLTCNASSTAAAGATGAGLVFAQQWLSSGGGLVRTGGLYGVKTAGDGGFGGGLAFYTQPNSSAAMSERARIDSDGLKFNGDTAAANALDDYEEGTWTPTVSSGTVSLVNTATYIKVGSLVFFQADLQLGGTRGSEAFKVGGLPFYNPLDRWTAVSMYHGADIGSFQQVVGVVSSNSTQVSFNGMGTDVLGTSFSNVYLNVSGVYNAS
jgi:hypothetical protein